MKEGRTDKGPIVVDGVTVGFCFGSGCWAEHEMGIRGLLDAFGAPLRPPFRWGSKDKVEILREIPPGIARKSSTQTPSRYIRIDTVLKVRPLGKRKFRDVHVRGFGVDTGGLGSDEYLKPHFRDTTPHTLTMWDENSLMFVTSDPSMFDLVDRLDAAITSKNLTIWVGGGGVFKGGGLCLLPRSDVPKTIVEAWEKADREEIELLAEAAATGIEDRLQAAGLDWYALTPARNRGELQFWLNPAKQSKYNAGWFSVDALDAWREGKGPVMKCSHC